MQSPLRFDPQWNQECFERRYKELRAAFPMVSSAEDTINLFGVWEPLRREVASWKSVTEIRNRQNTSDSEAKANSVAVAGALPMVEMHDSAIKRMLINSQHRDALESRIGSIAFDRWKLDLEASQENNGSLEAQAKLGDRYTRLLGNMQFQLREKKSTYAELHRMGKDPDRDVRRQASIAQWAPFEEHREEADDIFDQLVKIRTSMAQSLGEKTYTGLAYRRLGRLDYGISEVRALRDEIHENIVPLVASMVREQARALRVEAVMPWDETFYNAQSIPARMPMDQILRGLQKSLARIDPSIGEFAETLLQSGLTDLSDRAGKAPGAFSEFLPHVSMPFVFANATGAPSDAMTIAHETGHAFQNYCSRNHELLEFIVPTNEIGEIHSMALEFLLLRFCEEIFGDATDEFRSAHVRSKVSALPYIAAIDHFQELVYENPAADADERGEMWLHVQSRYMPWRSHGGIPTWSRGRSWQAQRHVYRFPFYYIDYGIAMCCALLLYIESQTDYRSAVERYLLLCKIGGTLPFKQMLQTAEMPSPFERGTLSGAVHALDNDSIG